VQPKGHLGAGVDPSAVRVPTFHAVSRGG